MEFGVFCVTTCAQAQKRPHAAALGSSSQGLVGHGTMSALYGLPRTCRYEWRLKAQVHRLGAVKIPNQKGQQNYPERSAQHGSLCHGASLSLKAKMAADAQAKNRAHESQWHPDPAVDGTRGNARKHRTHITSKRQA